MNKTQKIILGFAAAVFSLTAIFSVGYFQHDEHFQILEFASLKTQVTTADVLPWEYRGQIRPAIQVALTFILIKIYHLWHIDSPFNQILLLRIVTGLFSFGVIYFLYQTLLPQIRSKNKTYFLLLSFLIFFIPYVAVRFSSETWSGNFFILGLALTIKYYDSEKNIVKFNHNLLIGLILGLSFAFRFQTGLLILGLLFWLLFIKRSSLKNIFGIILGTSIIVGLGILIDYWYYQEWVLSAWNYFEVNIIENKTAEFGVNPWYFYFTALTDVGIFKFLTYPLITLCLGFFILKYKNPISFSVIPFLIAHLIIAHKEIRFLFPLAFLTPYMAIQVIQFFQEKIKRPIIKTLTAIFIIIPLITLNTATVVGKSFLFADGGVMVYKYLYDHYGQTDVKIYYLSEEPGFYSQQANLIMNFYDTKKFMSMPDCRLKKEDIKKIKPTKKTLLVAGSINNLTAYPLKPVHDVLPNWFRKLNKNNRFKIKNANWKVYEFTN